MKAVFEKGFGTGNRVIVAEAGQEIGGIVVPPEKIGFGTLCSINLNGILLKHSIPVDSKFGGILQIEDSHPRRFTDMISYDGSTLDPHEVFLKSKMTDVREATNGSGKILASLREIPAVSKDEAEAILRKADSAGLGKILLIGRPGQPVLGMPVGMERVGIVIPGGLNPVAACEEWGIETESKALSALVDFERLKNFWDIA
jgi:repressor of nif and glnA expression